MYTVYTVCPVCSVRPYFNIYLSIYFCFPKHFVFLFYCKEPPTIYIISCVFHCCCSVTKEFPLRGINKVLSTCLIYPFGNFKSKWRLRGLTRKVLSSLGEACCFREKGLRCLQPVELYKAGRIAAGGLQLIYLWLQGEGKEHLKLW
jgi:hypothetical protein